jgi:hypothetical protein
VDLKFEISDLKLRRSRVAGKFALLLFASLTLMSGCIADGRSRLPEQRVTYKPVEEAQNPAFLKQPAVASVHGATFDQVWQAIYRVTRNAGYYPELEDYRSGLFMTRPFVSSQWFEPWRRDVGSFEQIIAASLATMRRTVYWKVEADPTGGFIARPKVLVERYTLVEHRITSNAEYQEVFTLTTLELRNQRDRTSDPASWVTTAAPPTYWYAIGRDEPLERRLAKEAQDRVSGS